MSSNMTVVRVRPTKPWKTAVTTGHRLEELAVTAYGDSYAAAAAASDKMFDFIVRTFKENYQLGRFSRISG